MGHGNMVAVVEAKWSAYDGARATSWRHFARFPFFQENAELTRVLLTAGRSLLVRPQDLDPETEEYIEQLGLDTVFVMHAETFITTVLQGLHVSAMGEDFRVFFQMLSTASQFGQKPMRIIFAFLN